MISCVAAPIPVLRAPESPWREPFGIDPILPAELPPGPLQQPLVVVDNEDHPVGLVLWPRIASSPWLSSPQRSSL